MRRMRPFDRLLLIVATLLGGLFALKMYWRRLKAFFPGRPVEEVEKHRDALGDRLRALTAKQAA